MKNIKTIFKELLEKIESSNLPEGELMLGMAITINSKSWFRLKFNLILSEYTEGEIEDEGFVNEWTDLVDNLIEKSSFPKHSNSVQLSINNSNSIIANEPEEKIQTKSEMKEDLKEYLIKRYESKVDVKYIDLCIDVYFAILQLYKCGTVSGKISSRDCDTTLNVMNLTKKSFEECFEICAISRHYHDFIDDYEKDIVRKTVKSFII